jgi:3-hydroxybutyryl-CoA dehydrogenase
MSERLGIAGAGAIGCGLAVCAARHGDVILWARSDMSAARAETSVHQLCGRLSDEVDPARVQVRTEIEALAPQSFLIEAIAEDHDAKAALLARLGAIAGDDALLATTTSSLSVAALAQACGAPERFVALHVFNPVPKMKLVELAFPREATDETRARARELCTALGKTPVEVPDIPGFVVNRLLFPYLFSAVALQEETGLAPDAIDECMQLGAGHPMGPLALLDYVGLDVAAAIGDAIGADVPRRVRELVAEGALGKKSGRGFYDYGWAAAADPR